MEEILKTHIKDCFKVNGEQTIKIPQKGEYVISVDDKFSKPAKSCSGEDTVCNFISSMIEESKYCSDVMEKAI